MNLEERCAADRAPLTIAERNALDRIVGKHGLKVALAAMVQSYGLHLTYAKGEEKARLESERFLVIHTLAGLE